MYARRMKSYTTSDLSRRCGDVIADALRRPVAITQRGKPRLVVLAIDDFRRLLELAETRTVGTLETMPADLLQEITAALDRYAAED